VKWWEIESVQTGNSKVDSKVRIVK
jgi:hypothetical protein